MINKSVTEKSVKARIAEKPAGQFVKLEKIQPFGSLEARLLSGNVIMFYWRYSSPTKKGREQIGQYSPMIPPKALEAINGKYSLTAGIKQAERLAELHKKSLKDFEGGFSEIKEKRKKLKSKSARK